MKIDGDIDGLLTISRLSRRIGQDLRSEPEQEHVLVDHNAVRAEAAVGHAVQRLKRISLRDGTADTPVPPAPEAPGVETRV